MNENQKRRRAYHYANIGCQNLFHVPAGGQGGIRAYASATIDGCLAIRGIKVVEGGRDGLFVSMPSRKTQDGYKEVCFPVTAEFREQLYHGILDAYQQAITQAQALPAREAPAQEALPSGQQMGGM